MKRISFEWQFHPIGEVSLDDVKLRFPATTDRPGIYRFALIGADSSSYYIGETIQLHRRFGQYCAPGPTQWTNIRLNHEMRQVLASGGHVTIDIASEAWVITPTGDRTPIDLSSMDDRRRLEVAVLHTERQAGHRLLNR